jgi:DtxR family Mn-dependent transcriptional regulator
MSDQITNSIQDYLKSIYELTEDGQPASTTSLALRLGVKPASVTGMLQKLASLNPPLVNYHKHQGVKLTTKGRRAALEVIRHHRLLESWLVQTLGYSWDEVHKEAEKLEHVISEDFERRIAAAIGYSERDPHGDLIPSANLVMPKDESVSLSTLESEQEATVRRVDAHDTEFLRHLEELGLIPGACLKLLSVSLYDQLMSVQVRGRKETVILGPAITKRVFVEIL